MGERTPYWFEVYVDANAEWRWRFWGPNGRELAVSGEGHHTRQEAVAAISKVITEAGIGVSMVG